MNAKTDQWESYTDKAGRQHWRWPATGEGQMGADRSNRGAASPGDVGLSRQQQQAQRLVPLHQRGK
jgi:hypothetical protein